MQSPLSEPFGRPFVMTHPSVICPSCDATAGFGLRLIDDFLLGKHLVCQACRRTTNAWTAFLATINHQNVFMHDAAALFIGCKTAFFKATVERAGFTEISFTAHGVPANARILRLNYTPVGRGIIPVEFHGNDVPLRRGRSTVLLCGMPMYIPVGESPELAPTLSAEVNIYVAFVEPSPDEHARTGLANAFVALAAQEYVDVVIPATMAVEFTCKQLIALLRDSLKLNDEGTKDKDLLSAVIPTIATAAGMPPITDEIIRKVGRLWGQRDSVAHTGRLYEPYERKNAAGQLAAAVFAFRYLELLRQKAVKQFLNP